MSASECWSPPPFSTVSSEIDAKKKKMLWWEIGSEEKSLKNQNHCNFLSCGISHNRLTEPFLRRRWRGRGACLYCAALESWPLSHRLLISSGFQAAGGSSGCPFQGAVAPLSWARAGLQEIACGARLTKVLLKSGWELRV